MLTLGSTGLFSHSAWINAIRLESNCGPSNGFSWKRKAHNQLKNTNRSHYYFHFSLKQKYQHYIPSTSNNQCEQFVHNYTFSKRWKHLLSIKLINFYKNNILDDENGHWFHQRKNRISMMSSMEKFH